ncbi:protein similar isoform X2 [Athalia rosae]|uniref:protein similar isoform X2 n=1 Tax=Athalia rosae TaxID=37344 RepID=UPI002033BCEC|nr:protein similar isoform X2 [Athalia rosae]
MNWKTRVDSLADLENPNYYCGSENSGGMRSCAVSPQGSAGGQLPQLRCFTTATVDVEDLGRCFETNQNPPQQIPGHHRVFGAKRWGVGYGNVKVRGQRNQPSSPPPSELTWANMKEAFAGEMKFEQIRKGKSNEDFFPPDPNSAVSIDKMATVENVVDSSVEPDNDDHTRFLTRWTPSQRQCCPYLEHQDYQIPQQIYFDQAAAIPWFNQPLGSDIVEQHLVPDTPYHQKSFNFCSEEQWLRCEAVECPTLRDDYNFDTMQPIPPCMDYSSQVAFYYGEDVGYLRPAEYQRYEEDSLNEKRKEKSRDAARCRRSRETDIFLELAGALPVPVDQAKLLDKASVMRLAIAYLKVRTVIDAVPEPLTKREPSPDMDGLFLKALDGFMMVLSSDGDIVYLSENVSDYLGVSQMDMMGQNVYDYSHPCDHEELGECLSVKPSADHRNLCNLFLRLKCTLTSKGRKVNLKSASYKVIHCTGHMVITPRDLSAPPVLSEDNEDSSGASAEEGEPNEKKNTETGGCLVLVGCPIPHPSNIEVPLGQQTFLSKHSLNMKFTYADDKLAEYLGWDTSELVGQSLFEFHHALDNLVLDKSFKCLFSKGQCETAAYRFLGKKGGYAWVVTQATLIHCAKQHKPLSVVCVNYIVSGVECKNEVYSVRQLEARSVDAAAISLEEKEEEIDSTAASSYPVALVATVAVVKNEETRPAADRLLLNSLSIPVPIQQQKDRSKPLSVTASLFSQQDKPHKDFVASKKVLDPQKEEFLTNKPVSITKKIISANEQQRTRPLSVTKSIFAPAPQVVLEPTPGRPQPQTATASIFAPRTKEMNKGFLTFSEDQPGLTMLKDEPEDLTHLAPTPGDVCVPLEDTPFLSDMLDEFILGNDNYCPLLSPGLPNELRTSDLGDSLRDSELGDSLADSDPFMHRDSPSPCLSSGTPNLLSPAFSKSPGSIDSLCSPTGSGGGLSEDEMLMLSIGDVLADEELALRAPYIPMSDQDEALQLLISDDMVMWGPSQPPDKKTKWSTNSIEKCSDSNVSSSLEQLLRTNCSSSPSGGGGAKKCNDHGGGLVDPTDALGHAYKKNTRAENWLPKSERNSQKRIHTTSSLNPDNENKRIKCDQKISSCLLNDQIRSTNCLTSDQQSSQLLQQLMAQQSPTKNCSVGGGGGGGTNGCGTDNNLRSANATLQQQQSNSVLMNLLVSGCDEMIDPRNIPPLIHQEMSPLSVDLDNNVVPQMPSNLILEHQLSPDTRNELMNSMPLKTKPDVHQEVLPMDFDNFDLDVNSFCPELVQNSDLLIKILANNLVQ